MKHIRKHEKKILFVFILTIAIYTIFILFVDVKRFFGVSMRFTWEIIPLVLVLSFLNYVFRAIRFHYLLKKIHVFIPLRKSFEIFLAGISMTVTPGKVGEVVKAYLVKKETGTPVSKTIPLLVFERVTDGVAMIIMALAGVYFFRSSFIFFLLSLLVVVVFVCLVFAKKFIIKLLKNRFHWVKKSIKDAIITFLKESHHLFHKRVFFQSVFLGVIAWGCEGLALYLLIHQMVGDATVSVGKGIAFSFFIFSFSAIAAFFAFIPAGLGVAEVSVGSFLVLFFHMTVSQSAFLTLIFRLATLWFGVSVGLIFLSRVLKEK
ncbi:MAG TPA: lysylphosphatidylglycerol synthase transmembrane domain-containing protein [Patescibacteria group bacterium]|nr:lysylphosphatidylglycerol synthase transmembrane domain-containing protein [Patescibacteria group bacterium]